MCVAGKRKRGERERLWGVRESGGGRGERVGLERVGVRARGWDERERLDGRMGVEKRG